MSTFSFNLFKTILKSSYLFTEMMDKNTEIKNGIRFVGSVKEDKFANLSSVGFNFTLTSDAYNNNPVDKWCLSNTNTDTDNTVLLLFMGQC